MSLSALAALFVVGVAVIAVAGPRLATLGDRLADETGWGEAIIGAVFIGATTSLSGSVTSVVAAAEGRAGFAVSNAVGGIAAQMAFLAVADMAYRKANLEHAAASEENLLQAGMLMVLLTLPLLAAFGPRGAIFGIHPVTPVLVGAYVFGLRLLTSSHAAPMWFPRITRETLRDEPKKKRRVERRAAPWFAFAAVGLVVGGAGWLLAETGIAIADRTGLSETLVGGVLTAVATSSPELVVAVSAVRNGALTLAVGNIVGGNTYDVMFVAIVDVAYREGSVYHAMQTPQIFLLALTVLLCAVLLVGLLRREKHGIGNIGLESFLLLLIYAAGLACLFFI